MRRLLVGFFATIGVLSVLLVIAVVVVVIRFKPVTPALPGNIILSVDLRQSLADGPSEPNLLRLIAGGKSNLRDFLDAIEAAATDPRVTGILARLGNDEFAVAKAQQIRDAIVGFRAKGKFAIAFADSFGEFGAGTRPYYLATAFDQIWLQPMGSVGLTGLYSGTTFFRGTFDRLGIVPEFDHRGSYKTAANILTETKMTPPQREEVEDLLAAVAGQVVSGIAKARKLSPDAVRTAIDRGPLLADEALQASLVDRLGYRDEAIAAARKRAGPNAELIGLSTYLDGAKLPYRAGERIALIYGSGLIVRGSGAAGPLSGAEEVAADKITRAFSAAVRDPKVRAILFRIDSPGGSVVAS
jgi:protease IV